MLTDTLGSVSKVWYRRRDIDVSRTNSIVPTRIKTDKTEKTAGFKHEKDPDGNQVHLRSSAAQDTACCWPKLTGLKHVNPSWPWWYQYLLMRIKYHRSRSKARAGIEWSKDFRITVESLPEPSPTFKRLTMGTLIHHPAKPNWRRYWFHGEWIVY